MSDQFADLWSSSAPKPKPQTLSAPQRTAPRPSSKPDVFTLLASSTPPSLSRPLTPSTRPPAPPKSSGDAFSDLFSSASHNGNANTNAKLTLAARLAMEAQQRTPSPLQQQQSTAAHSHSPWAGLDSLGAGNLVSSSTAPTASSKQSLVDDDDWGLGDFGAATTTTSSRSMPRQAHPQLPQKMTTSLWDLEDFSSPNSNGSGSDSLLRNDQSVVSRSSSSQANRKKSSVRPEADSLLDFGVASPDTDFDFGNREDQSDDDGQAVDLLGVPNAPVAKASNSRHQENSQTRQDSQETNGRPSVPRSSSPPPHVLGQLVEMGFSVEQAKTALKDTKNGQDAQAALESLLDGSGTTRPSRARDDRPPVINVVPPPIRTHAPPKGQKERERERLERQRQAAMRDGGEGSIRAAPSSVTEIQDHADKLLAQASEIGLSMFSKASAFWKEGKEKVVKAYEERNVEVRGQATVGNRRPKWMQDVVHSDEDDDTEQRNRNGIKDLDGFKETYVGEEREEDTPRSQEPKTQIPEVEFDLFSDGPPQRSSPAAEAKPKSQISRPASSSSSRSQRPPAPSPQVIRNLLSASPSSLALAEKHKTLGTEQFKLGQHAAAAESYTAAIAALPEGHLLSVPLHTNRALARLKTGEYIGAVGDCQKAVEAVFGKAIFSSAGKGTSNDVLGFADPLTSKDTSTSSTPPPLLHPSQIPPNLVAAGRSHANNGGWCHPQGIGVDLLDGYVKALRRAAEACEGREKWVDAGMWWSVLSRAGEGEGGGWVEEKTRKEAVSGGVRCRKMVDESSGSSSVAPAKIAAIRATPTTKPKPKPGPKQSAILTNVEPSRALLALQSSNAQAESEDAARHALKDTVDARLSLWKTGKENNIRALLASLELVLWEAAISGLKMGMADLVSSAQVKKGYMKAIGRVHPDKLNASNSTLEQRMLANGVFGVLNEAWIAFQTTQR